MLNSFPMKLKVHGQPGLLPQKLHCNLPCDCCQILCSPSTTVKLPVTAEIMSLLEKELYAKSN